MPRPKQALTSVQLEQIRQQTVQTFGKPLRFSVDCEELSKDIQRVTTQYLSPNTLRRLFGFLHAPFAPAIKTLHVLSLYNGFPNWHSFEQSPPTAANFQSLTLDEEAHFYLDFYKIEVRAEADMNYHNAARNIALRILFSTALLQKLAPALAKNKVAQVYFFERFPYIDGLCTGYKTSLQLYLQKRGKEAQVFGNSLLFLASFLAANKKDMGLYHTRLQRFAPSPEMHPFTVARLIGTNLLMARNSGGDCEQWLVQAATWNRHFMQKSNGSFWDYPYFQHMMADYLNLAGFLPESHQIARTMKRTGKKHEIEKGYEEALEVIRQVAGSHRSAADYKTWFQTTEVFDSIHPLFKKFYRLQALKAFLQAMPTKSKSQRAASELQSLVAQTGFTYFSIPE